MKMSCDRCRKTFEGFEWPGGMTAGFYYVTEGGWSEYRQTSDEEVVCDDCMFVDPKYIAIYGRCNVTGNN